MLARTRQGATVAILLWILLLAAVLICLYLVGQARIPIPTEPTGVRHPSVGVSFTHLSLQPLTGDGAAVQLEDVAGRPFLINFWGEWCPPCRIEFPHLVKLRTKLEAGGGAFFSVSCGGGDGPEDPDELQFLTKKFLEQRRVKDFPTYWDPDFATRLNFFKAAQLSEFAYPMTVLVDAQGVIQGIWVGYWVGAEKEMEQAALSLLASGD